MERPHISIVGNFSRSTPDSPSLLTLREVETLFHEFGHALHGLLSDVTYTELASPQVWWDFVELPSQIMENWVLEDETLALFAHHFQTGEVMPRDLVEKVKSATTFQKGTFNIRQLNFGLLDMAYHNTNPIGITDVLSFEEKILAPIRLFQTAPGTAISTIFSHIFAGGYSSGYYSYKWAEVLDADAFEKFKEEGIFNKTTAKSFRDNILSRGNTAHPMELYVAFRGRKPDPDAMLRRDGLL
jgi:Zn-dependent oligopeptidase